MQQQANDEFDWEIMISSENAFNAPKADNTSGTGNFLHLNTHYQGENGPGSIGRIHVPVASNSPEYCMYLSVNMMSGGALRVS